MMGAIAVLILIGTVGIMAFILARGLLLLPVYLGLPAIALIASTLIAQRSLHAHVARVAAALAMPGIIRANAADATINKWLDEFQPSTLTRDQQIEELTGVGLWIDNSALAPAATADAVLANRSRAFLA